MQKNLLESHSNLSEFQADWLEVGSSFSSSPEAHQAEMEPIDFKITSLIGNGAQGKVLKCMANGEVMALKVVCHDTYINEPQAHQEHLINSQRERMIMNYLSENKRLYPFTEKERDSNGSAQTLPSSSHLSTFVVSPLFTIEGEKHSVIGMEYIEGKDLFTLLQEQKTFTEERVRHFSANIALGLQYLHRLNIQYRDLKLDNVILDQQGHCKIVDFGLSRAPSLEIASDPGKQMTMPLSQEVRPTQKRRNWGRKSTAYEPKQVFGTVEYMPPEFLLAQEYSEAGDFWQLGCVIYEMAVGVPPFNQKDMTRLTSSIIYSDPDFSCVQNPDLKDLLLSLLQKNPRERLSCFQALFTHPFFASYNFDQSWFGLHEEIDSNIKAAALEKIQEDKQLEQEEDGKESPLKSETEHKAASEELMKEFQEIEQLVRQWLFQENEKKDAVKKGSLKF